MDGWTLEQVRMSTDPLLLLGPFEYWPGIIKGSIFLVKKEHSGHIRDYHVYPGPCISDATCFPSSPGGFRSFNVLALKSSFLSGTFQLQVE